MYNEGTVFLKPAVDYECQVNWTKDELNSFDMYLKTSLTSVLDTSNQF